MFTLRLITRSPTAAAQNNSKGICQRCVSSCRADFSQPSNQTTSNFFLLYAIVIADLTDCCLPRHQQLFKKLSFHARFELQFYFLDRFGSTWRKRKEKGESVSLPQWWRSNPSSFFPCKFLDLVAIVSTKYNAKAKVATPGARIRTTSWTLWVCYYGLEGSLWENGQEEQPKGYVKVLCIKFVCVNCIDCVCL